MTESVRIIAEIGVNHGGDLDSALRLCSAAKNSGADVAKFQFFRAQDLVTKNAKLARYQVPHSHYKSQLKLLEGLELSVADLQILKNYCQSIDIGFMVSVFSEDDLEILSELSLEEVKIPSGEICNLPLLRAVAKSDLQVILSTGMTTPDEVERAVFELKSRRENEDFLTVLHCNSMYPPPDGAINLRGISFLRDTLGVVVGFSDHSIGRVAAVGAVALGAKVIEKHLTLDNELSGPDHLASAVPEEFHAMVQDIRRLEQMLGDRNLVRSEEEMENAAVVRKSVATRTSLFAGQPISAKHLKTMRPASGISPIYWDQLIGKRANRAYEPNELLDSSILGDG